VPRRARRPRTREDIETLSVLWLERFSRAKTWRDGLALGEELSELPPDESLAILQRIYHRIPSIDSRQQLLKSFVFDGAKENACEVLHLAATDSEIAVQTWAFQYLRSFAWRDFSADYSAYREWRARTAGLPLKKILETSAADFMARTRDASGAALASELELFARSDACVLDEHAPEILDRLRAAGALAQSESWIASGDPRLQQSALAFAARIGSPTRSGSTACNRCSSRVRTRRPTSRCKRCSRSSGHSSTASSTTSRTDRAWLRGRSGRRRSIGHGCVGDRGVEGSGRGSVADRARRRRRSRERARRIRRGARALTGVRPDSTHDAAFWMRWWSENQERLPPAVRGQTITPRRAR
jgi:hypothetical protein